MSGAAGVVGTVAGQIAKIKKCRVVGITGGRQKCDYLTQQLGFDAAIDYKSENVKKSLRQHCREASMCTSTTSAATFSTSCSRNWRATPGSSFAGAISQYNSTTGVKGPANYLSLLANHASMTGIIGFDYADRYAEAAREMAGWMAAGKVASGRSASGSAARVTGKLRRLRNSVIGRLQRFMCPAGV